MAKIEIENERYFEKSLKRFKRSCIKEGIFKECRERRHFVKPSQKRREKGKRKK
ncbi:MAG: 30S ribosomal protein S21 [Candidatus Omnitrophica bacterium]|nr:30S ribosomal protein S21 [Candidatus Omnitrophota bacterium]